MSKANYHGSKKESGQIGPGTGKSAGQLGAGNPGKAAMRVKPRMSGLPFEGGSNSYSPKGLKKTSEGR